MPERSRKEIALQPTRGRKVNRTGAPIGRPLGSASSFHGVHWTRAYQGWTHFVETGFVVLNRAGEVLFIEQKSGPLVVETEGPVFCRGAGKREIRESARRQALLQAMDPRHDGVEWAGSFAVQCRRGRFAAPAMTGDDGR